jgi:hypothetical protein
MGYTGISPVPAIIDFHPLAGTGSSQEGSSGWKAKCDSALESASPAPV